MIELLEQDVFTLKIETANAAFQEEHPTIEIARILRKLADQMEFGGGDIWALLDGNGNKVGKAERS